MPSKPAKKGRGKPNAAPPGPRELAIERTRIRKSMSRWQRMDEIGRELGRGLGKRELVDRVAQETGTSARQVQSALKSA